jgi:hypothetical protein
MPGWSISTDDRFASEPQRDLIGLDESIGTLRAAYASIERRPRNSACRYRTWAKTGRVLATGAGAWATRAMRKLAYPR